jgi:hypothetical protein
MSLSKPQANHQRPQAKSDCHLLDTLSCQLTRPQYPKRDGMLSIIPTNSQNMHTATTRLAQISITPAGWACGWPWRLGGNQICLLGNAP